MAGADTRFRIGSLTKQFTAAAILKLEKKGLLRVEDPIRKLLPALLMALSGKPVPPPVGAR